MVCGALAAMQGGAFADRLRFSQPRKKKPFIDRKTAKHYFVVHRSQQDPRYHEEDASKYVLVEMDKKRAHKVRVRVGAGDAEWAGTSTTGRSNTRARFVAAATCTVAPRNPKATTRPRGYWAKRSTRTGSRWTGTTTTST